MLATITTSPWLSLLGLLLEHESCFLFSRFSWPSTDEPTNHPRRANKKKRRNTRAHNERELSVSYNFCAAIFPIQPPPPREARRTTSPLIDGRTAGWVGGWLTGGRRDERRSFRIKYSEKTMGEDEHILTPSVVVLLLLLLVLLLYYTAAHHDDRAKGRRTNERRGPRQRGQPRWTCPVILGWLLGRFIDFLFLIRNFQLNPQEATELLSPAPPLFER